MTWRKLTGQQQEDENKLRHDSRRFVELEHKVALEAQWDWDKLLHGRQFESHVIRGSFASYAKRANQHQR